MMKAHLKTACETSAELNIELIGRSCARRVTRRSRIALIAVGSISSDACGDAAQDFYRNKQVRLTVGHPVGNDHERGLFEQSAQNGERMSACGRCCRKRLEVFNEQ